MSYSIALVATDSTPTLIGLGKAVRNLKIGHGHRKSPKYPPNRIWSAIKDTKKQLTQAFHSIEAHLNDFYYSFVTHVTYSFNWDYSASLVIRKLIEHETIQQFNEAMHKLAMQLLQHVITWAVNM
jgi:hypothetical protein